MKILILTDGKAGHENQSKAFARALRAESEIRPVRFKGSFAKSLSYLLDNIGIRIQRLFSLDGPAPSRSDGFDAVVGTGSGTFYAAKTIARAIGGTRNVSSLATHMPAGMEGSSESIARRKRLTSPFIMSRWTARNVV